MLNANIASSYQLRRPGADGLLGNGDDPLITVSSASVIGNTATLNFAALPEDVYRLTILDAITDLTGNSLDGDGNGLAAGVACSDFVVNATGDVELDHSFGGNGVVSSQLFNRIGSSEQAAQMVIQSDGKIVVVGSNGVVRYTVNGDLDMSFGVGGKAFFKGDASSVAVQSDGKIVVAGFINNSFGNSDFAVARYNTNGSIDTTFRRRRTADYELRNSSGLCIWYRHSKRQQNRRCRV